jgi:adenine deaminase
MPDRERLLAVARGDEPADLVVRGARVLSVFTDEWLDADVAVCGGVIAGIGSYRGRETLEARGRPLVPGLIDAHMHLESSKLLPEELSRLLLERGTTAVVADPHEIANVLGAAGVHWLIDRCAGLPLDVWFKAPSCVPASPFESPYRPLGGGDLAGILQRRRVLGLAEMMDFPAVVAGDGSELAKLALPGAGRVDGHAPGLRGAPLQAYAAAGIASDHESVSAAEGLERLRAGMWLLVREASAARNLAALLPLVRRHPHAPIAFCTDDRDPAHIVDEGHLDGMLRAAVAGGLAPERALAMASINAARCHGLERMGAIAPGYAADMLLLEDLRGFRAVEVLKRGGRPAASAPPLPVPEWVRSSVRIPALPAERFRLPCEARRVRVIGIVPDQIVTEALSERPTLRGGCAVADPARDLAKLAVVERHVGSGRVGVGLVHGLGLARGALASTVAHDAHNVIAAGVDDDDLARAVRRLAEIGGGYVVVAGGAVAAELPLPVAGLLSDRPAAEVVAATRACDDAACALGCRLAAPFHALSFLALSVIPALKLTDRGLVDVERRRVVGLALEEDDALRRAQAARV